MYRQTQELIEQFLLIAKDSVAYDDERKKLFHHYGKKLLKQIAIDLPLPSGGYDLRSNLGGIAVSGEITLHAETLYVQFAQRFSGLDIPYRRCLGRKDYCGGINRWLPFSALQQYPSVMSLLRQEGRI